MIPHIYQFADNLIICSMQTAPIFSTHISAFDRIFQPNLCFSRFTFTLLYEFWQKLKFAAISELPLRLGFDTASPTQPKPLSLRAAVLKFLIQYLSICSASGHKNFNFSSFSSLFSSFWILMVETSLQLYYNKQNVILKN